MADKTKIEGKNISFEIHSYYEKVIDRLAKLKSENIIQRIETMDYTIWSDKPKEITDRMGWLESPERSKSELDEIKKFVSEIIKEGFTHALLMGMGGSSLAPEVFRKTFGVKKGYLDLSVIDSTHPEVVLEYERKLDPAKTLYIVSTKSGGTIETISFMKYFYNSVVKKLGIENASNHFIAITDSGSGLEDIAKQLKFRKIFLNDPNIGGRYSALSLFGVVPAALVGVDLEKLLARASRSLDDFIKHNDVNSNTAALLGCAIGELALQGRDKLTFVISKELESFGSWVEQLIAESMGKIGKGILPVDLEPVLSPEYYSNDRIFVHIKFKGDSSKDNEIEALKNVGYPLITIELNDLYELGGQYFTWEAATSIMGWVIGIQPFNQPNVEAAKVSARQMMKEYEDKGKLPQLAISVNENGIETVLDKKYSSTKEALDEFLGRFNSGTTSGTDRSYISIQAYLKPSKEVNASLQKLRTKLQKKFKSAVTVGYGPRFLHSTGQLHKGDAGNGLFIQLTGPINEDAAIPDKPASDESSFTFGVLISAQSLGDRNALIEKKRNVIRFHIKNNIIDGLDILSSLID